MWQLDSQQQTASLSTRDLVARVCIEQPNIEICDAVGRENIFIFGHTADEVDDLRAKGYRPRQLYEENPELRTALDQIRTGFFSPEDPLRFSDIFHTLVDWGDHYMVLADFVAFAEAQKAVDERFRDTRAWTESALENVAGMGQFSSDRTITESDYTNNVALFPVTID